MAVDGSIIFNTKIDIEGFDKGSKQLSSRILSLKSKVSATETEVEKLTAELDALAKTEIKSKTVESLEKSVESAKIKLSELEGKAENIFQNTRSDLFDMGFDDSNLDGILAQNKEWVKLQEKIAKADEELQSYANQLNYAKETETSTFGIDTDEYERKKEKLFQLTQKLNVYKTQLREAEQKEKSFSEETADSTKTLSKFISAVKELGKKLSSTFKGVAIKSVKNFTGHIKNLFKGTKRVNNQMSGLAKSINRIKQAIGGMLLYKVIQGGIESLKESLQEMAKASPNVNKQLSALMTSFTYMKNTLATAFLPLLTVVTPILTSFMDTISGVINKVAEFFSALTGQSTYVKAVKVQQDYAKSLDDTTKSTNANTKATKDNQKSLAGYDELNVMQSSEKENADNSEVTSPLFQTVAVPFSKFADELRQAFSKGDYSGIAKILAQRINSALARIDWKSIGKRIAKGIGVALNFLYTLITDLDWLRLGNSIGNLINGALSKYNASLFAKTLSNLISGMVTSLSEFIRTIRWDKVSSCIIAFLSNIKWSNISRVVVGLVNSLSKAIKTFNFKGIGVALRNGLSKINWKNLWNSVTNLFTNALKGLTDFFGLKGVSTSPLNKALKDIYSSVSNLLRTIKQMVGTLIKPIINNFLPAMVKVIGNIMKGVTPIIKAVTPVFKTVIKVISSVMNSLSPAISSIGDVIGNIINVLSPFLRPIGELISGVANILGPAISTIFDFISGLLAPLSGVTSLLGDVISKFTSPFESETITQEMQAEIDELQSTTEDLKTIVDDTKSSIEETESALSSVTEDTSEIDNLKNQLQELVEKANLTPEEQQEMKTVAELLAEKVPGFEKTWENLTYIDDKGKVAFKKGKEEMVASIDEVINKYKEQYLTQALQDQYKDLYKQKIEQNAKVAEAQEKVNEAQKKMNKLYGDAQVAQELMNQTMGNGEAYDKAVKEYEKATGAVETYGKEFNNVNKAYLEAKGSQAKLETELKSLSGSVEVVSGKFKKSNDNLQAIRDTFERGIIDETTLKKQFGLTAKELYSQTKSIGESVDKGYKEGLEGSYNDLVDSSAGASQEIIKSMKSSLRINSPSKETEELGRYTAEGLVDDKGLNDSSILANGFRLFRKNLSIEMKRIKATIKSYLVNIPSCFANTFSSIWDKIKPSLNDMLDGFQSFFNYLVGGLNEVASNLNAVGKVTNKSYARIPVFPNVTLPRYATGTVVPANYGEFAAILGDNKREPEVVSPLSTMKQAFKEALSEGNIGGGGDINLTINLDGEPIFKDIIRRNDREKKRFGKSVFA